MIKFPSTEILYIHMQEQLQLLLNFYENKAWTKSAAR